MPDNLTIEQPASLRAGPDSRGHFGPFGGRYVAETLMPLILELETAYRAAQADPAFRAELEWLLKHYVGRPSPLYFAEKLTAKLVVDWLAPMARANRREFEALAALVARDCASRLNEGDEGARKADELPLSQ